MQIKIPFLAEGVESGTVVSILIKEGAQVKKDQTVLELETNKATAPIPSPEAGVVTKILVKEGQEVSIGQAVITLSEIGAGKGVRQKEKSIKPPEPSQTVTEKSSTGLSKQDFSKLESAQSESYTYKSKSGLPPPASPSIRRMAQELGIDLTRVRGTEQGGRITAEDLKSYIQDLQAAALEKVHGAVQKPTPVSIDFSKWGTVTRKPLSSIRRIIGQKMQESWTSIPHVTQFAEADITPLLEFRKKYAPLYEGKGAKLTVTGVVLKLVVRALKKYPAFNSSLDETKNEVVYKEYFHLGVAVDTEQGLLVPVLKDVDKKDLLNLSIELAQLAEKTRQRKISLEEVQGATFTISNLGSIGGSHFTPIVNKPEVAILGLGQGALKPVVKDGKIQTRMMLPLCLSYDHRVIDGADGARFIQELVHEFEHMKEKDFKLNDEKSTKKPAKKIGGSTKYSGGKGKK